MEAFYDYGDAIPKDERIALFRQRLKRLWGNQRAQTEYLREPAPERKTRWSDEERLLAKICYISEIDAEAVIAELRHYDQDRDK